MGTASEPTVPAVRGGIVARPALFARLDGAARITQISAPAGSGKSFLLRSWIAQPSLADHAAFVLVHGAECDQQRFWICVANALRGTSAGSKLVRDLTAAPDLDGWAIVERLLTDLAPLADRVRLVIDDVHELDWAEALPQLELMIMRAPRELRFVLATRGDLRLGLHRLRLEGELTDIRAADLQFTLNEAGVLFRAAGLDIPDSALAHLYERTEGWAAGLRLAALSLAGHPDPERFAAEFSGSEPTVTEYLLAEVLDRQSAEVRRLLLRTSILERINGALADRLTARSGTERILQDLEKAGVFVVPLDKSRRWFRYHPMFAEMLRLELRRTAPGEITGLHAGAAGWFAENGFPREAIRHAQAAADWPLAGRLLSDHWVGLELDGQAATALLAGFPTGVVAASAELTALTAIDALERGSLEDAERWHGLAARMSDSVSSERREHLDLTLTVVRLSIARKRGDLTAAVEQSERVLRSARAQDAAEPGLVDELSALALISLGAAETWSIRVQEADRHLERGIALARRAGRPYLEILGLGHWAIVAQFRALPAAAERAMQAIELARANGWADEPIAAAAFTTLSVQMLWRGRLDEAERWLERAQRVVREETDPVAAIMLYYARGLLELARGRDEEALRAFRLAEHWTNLVVPHHPLAVKARAFLLHTWTRLGDTRRVEQTMATMDAHERQVGEAYVALAALRLAQGDQQAAAAALAPVLDGSAPVMEPYGWMIQPFLLEAIARDALGDSAATGRALERALDLAESGGLMLPFLLHPAARILDRHASHGTAHRALISQILALLAGQEFDNGPPWLHASLSDSEIRVLRYLPTNLSAPDIAGELSLSVNTVRTHMRRVYQKLGVHRRTNAVERARDLGLLAPSSRMG